MPSLRFLPRHMGALSGLEDHASMLRPRTVPRPVPGIEGARRVGGPDRAMDVLQYGLAVLALVVALLLAGLR